MNAYYQDVLTRPAQARSRAQAAYTVAAAIATALITAGIFSDFKEADRPVKILGVVAVTLWACTALAFMFAVGQPVKRAYAKPNRPNLVDEILADAKSEADEVDGGIKLGLRFAIAAVFVTLSTLVLGGFPKLTNWLTNHNHGWKWWVPGGIVFAVVTILLALVPDMLGTPGRAQTEGEGVDS